MAHFSKLDANNKVEKVVVISNEITTPDGVNENEQLGIDFLVSQYGGVWKHTTDDVFISTRPYPSWTLDSSHDWQPPTPKPEGDYIWKEATLSWAAPD